MVFWLLLLEITTYLLKIWLKIGNCKITIDGEQNKIINGATDWVYEEEFSLSKAFFWSPDSKKIAYYRFDETEVKEFSMMIWGDLYPNY
ncbi:MAG: DPP IV N-terminal domain-containing protein [Bacteroidales bacterium]